MKKDNLGAAEGITLKKGIRARVALEKADNFGKSFGKKDKKSKSSRIIKRPQKWTITLTIILSQS